MKTSPGSPAEAAHTSGKTSKIDSSRASSGRIRKHTLSSRIHISFLTLRGGFDEHPSPLAVNLISGLWHASDVAFILVVPSPREDDTMKLYLTVGLSMLAGAALLEAALIPGLVIGAAAVLVPKYLPKLRPRPRSGSSVQRSRARRHEITPPAAAPAHFGIKQAIAKTITFRIIVTTLDFTTNYVVIGELAAAAGLSTLNLVVGPVFYLAHETVWNYYCPAE